MCAFACLSVCDCMFVCVRMCACTCVCWDGLLDV